MKTIFTLFILMCVVQASFSQYKSANDPSYSINNYKHPNKAANAVKIKSDELNLLETSSAMVTENYKQPKRTKATKQMVTIEARKQITKNSSSKHPMGL
jgi:hypothetical protein